MNDYIGIIPLAAVTLFAIMYHIGHKEYRKQQQSDRKINIKNDSNKELTISQAELQTSLHESIDKLTNKELTVIYITKDESKKAAVLNIDKYESLYRDYQIYKEILKCLASSNDSNKTQEN